MAAAVYMLFARLLFGPLDPVDRIEQVSVTAYDTAIDHAVSVVDPQGLHPDWRDELYRICRRESWCGKFGTVRVHKADGWVGAGAWVNAVAVGQLDPEHCEAHRLVDYAPALKYVQGRSRGRMELTELIEELPTGSYAASDFATRGGWGQNAARALHLLGRCTAPTAMDDPRHAALVAALTIRDCKKGKTPCTCADRVRKKWVGAGTFDRRSLFGRWRSVRRQCGDHHAVAWLRQQLHITDDRGT